MTRATARELALWAEEWRRPQAIVWEANGQEREVALYVRSLRTAEMRRASVAARTLVRQYMAELGLTLPGLRSQRWIIDHEAEQRPVQGGRTLSGPSARDRLKVVTGGAS